MSVILEPNALMEAFGITEAKEHERINNRIIERVRMMEDRAERVRARDKKRVIGREGLLSQALDTQCQQERHRRSM